MPDIASVGQSAGENPPEWSFPVTVVAAHGVPAVATVVLVLLAMLGNGASEAESHRRRRPAVSATTIGG